MRIEQLHYFDTLIQEGTFTKAAAQLHIAQPSLTASIKAMEKELDTKLINREAGGISLTEEGHKVLRFSQAVLRLQQNLLEELKLSSIAEESITVFASNFFYKIILENFLPDFTEHTQMTIRAVESEFEATLEWFFIHNCNFAIISRLTAEDESKCAPDMLLPDEKFYDENLTYIPIYQTEFGVCLSNYSPLHYVEDFTPAYLSMLNYPTTMFPRRSIKLTNKVLFSTSTIASHIQALSQNKAISSLPRLAYDYYFAKESNLTFRPYANNMLLTYYLVYPQNHTLTGAEQVFIEALAKYLSQLNLA